MQKVPLFKIDDYPNHRAALVELLLWLRAKNKSVSVMFMVEWFGLTDHRGFERILKALEDEGMFVTKRLQRQWRPTRLYRLKNGVDPRKPANPNQSEMIWRTLQQATKPLTMREIGKVTGGTYNTISSYVQRLKRGGFVSSATLKAKNGQQHSWAIHQEYRDADTPVVRTVDGKRIAVLADG